MKKSPQYTVTIDVIRERVSRSFNAILLKGFFFALMIRKIIKTMNTRRAYASTPKLLTKTEMKINTIFLYMITISQK